MKRKLVVLVAAALLAVTAAGGATAQPAQGHLAQQQTDCDFPVEVTDATGETVTVEEEPQRVVVLAPSAAQTMWAIGAEEKVVGMPVNQYTAYLNGSAERTNIVDESLNPVQEEVVALEPDLVLAPNALRNANQTVQSLRDAGVTVYHFRKANSMAYVNEKTRTTGKLVGACEAAEQQASQTEAAVEEIRTAVAGEDRPRVLYLLGPSGYAAGSNTFIGELVDAAGGENIAGELSGGYSVVSGETILAEDPEWIVVPEGRSLPKTEAINATTAVQEGQVLRVNDNFMNQPGPRTVVPLRTMAEAFHPEAFEEPTTTTAVSDGTTAGDATETMPGDAAETTPGGGSPGYTAVTALLAAALLAAGALLGRD